MDKEYLLQVRNLRIEAASTLGRSVELLRGVSFSVGKGEIHVLIGESGSGKSLLAAAILHLLPPSLRASGEVLFEGKNLLSLPEKELIRIRGTGIGLVPQQGETSLNPVRKIVKQLLEPFSWKNSSEVYRKGLEILRRLGFEYPEQVFQSYPQELSGGMNRRIVLAGVLLLNPRLILVDEPTVGLDEENKVRSIQEILSVLASPLRGILIITHELTLLESIEAQVLVLYGGVLVEETDTERLFAEPLHPYTKALLDASPGRGFNPIPGLPYSPLSSLSGCPFHPRCTYRLDVCFTHIPAATIVESNNSQRPRRVWCHRYG